MMAAQLATTAKWPVRSALGGELQQALERTAARGPRRRLPDTTSTRGASTTAIRRFRAMLGEAVA